MAIIQSPTGVQQEVDLNSKASRVTLYDASGIEIFGAPLGAFMAPVNIRQTAATVAGSTVWAMRNGTGRTISIKRAKLIMGFDGTTVALTTPRYSLNRFTLATPTTGTPIVPIKQRTSYAASTVADIRQVDTGLTVAGITFETEALVLALPLQTIFGAPTTGYAAGPVANHDIIFDPSGKRSESFELAPNEGLAIRLSTAAVIGLSLTGFVSWEER